ncbi:MAG: hypothetical protein ACOCQN_04405 [Halanaerobiaceae bacterium]
MGIMIGKYKFEGPYLSMKKLKNRAGLYAIHTLTDTEYRLIDIGEAPMVKDRVFSHERMKCWLRNCRENIYVSAYYTPHWSQMGRKKLVNKIRSQLNPPCGSKLDGKFNFLVE